MLKWMNSMQFNFGDDKVVDAVLMMIQNPEWFKIIVRIFGLVTCMQNQYLITSRYWCIIKVVSSYEYVAVKVSRSSGMCLETVSYTHVQFTTVSPVLCHTQWFAKVLQPSIEWWEKRMGNHSYLKVILKHKTWSWNTARNHGMMWPGLRWFQNTRHGHETRHEIMEWCVRALNCGRWVTAEL